MAVVFNYPETFPATVVTFTRDPGVGGFEQEKKWLNPSAESASGVRFVYDKQLSQQTVMLTWKNMNKTDQASALSFLGTVDGSGEYFHFTDPLGDCYYARVLTSSLSWNPVDVDGQGISLELILISATTAIDYLALENETDLILTENSHTITEEY